MIYEKKQTSSGVAKAALATAIPAAAVSLGNAMAGCNGGILGNLLGNGRNGSCCNEDHLVDRFTLAQSQEIESLKSQIALRDANEFTQRQQLEMYKYVDGRMRDIEKQLCKQEVVNQRTADSIQMVSERAQCCCSSLEEKICAETAARKCADNTIVNYVNATFYPKQVADVTTGTTTTAQTLYNPLPIQVDGGTCGCNC